jgi:hypothetical protein
VYMALGELYPEIAAEIFIVASHTIPET